MCHLTPTALATPAGQVAGGGKPAQRRWAPLWARPAGAPGSWPSRTPQSRGRKGLGPRRLPVGTPPPAHTARCQAAAATGPPVLGWPVTRALPLSSHQPELQDKEGVLPSRPGSPTFRRMRQRGRISCGMGGAGGTRALARPHLGSEVRGPVLGDSAVAPAADRTSARPPRPPPAPAPVHPIVVSSANAHRVFSGPPTRPPGHGRPWALTGPQLGVPQSSGPLPRASSPTRL